MRNVLLFIVVAAVGCMSPESGQYEGSNLVNDQLGLNNWKLYKKEQSFERSFDLDTESDQLETQYRGHQRTVGDYNCADFPTQRNAQLAFIKAGGPSKDPFNLDRDGDGFACEFNPERYMRQYYRPKSASDCHYVRSYYRKDGTFVRGHRRCR